jgi:hypothetical protein
MATPAWRERAADLLFDGEEVVEAVPFGERRVVVTTHRVLAFTPQSEPRYRYVDRPNVTGVEADTEASGRWLGLAVRGIAVGLPLAVVGRVVEFGDLFSLPDVSTGGRFGAGGMLGVLESLMGALAMVDEALLVGGLLATVLGIGAFGRYVETREHVVRIAVAGEDDITVPVEDPGTAAVDQLREAIGPVASP